MLYQVDLNKIRQARRHKGYSMQYMADKLEISGKSSYFQREKGKVPFKATELQQVADILGLDSKKILRKTYRKSNKEPEAIS